MKRSLIVLCVAALLATLPLASIAEARRHGRPGWSNRTTKGGSYRRANPARRGWQGWQGWRGWRGCQDTQPEEVMVEICRFLQEVVDIGSGTAVVLGELTEVPESEVAAYLADGGSTDFYVLTDADRNLFYLLFGINEDDIGNANVWFWAD